MILPAERSNTPRLALSSILSARAFNRLVLITSRSLPELMPILLSCHSLVRWTVSCPFQIAGIGRVDFPIERNTRLTIWQGETGDFSARRNSVRFVTASRMRDRDC